MNDLSPGARLITTSASPVFPDVTRGVFADGLYYRINTFTLMLNEEPDAPGLDHVQKSPESSSSWDTTF